MNHIITCPCCGAQYLPAEIFIPEEVFKTDNKQVQKSPIDGVFPENFKYQLDLAESYICDFCDTSFRVYMDVDFRYDDLESLPKADESKITVNVKSKQVLTEDKFK